MNELSKPEFVTHVKNIYQVPHEKVRDLVERLEYPVILDSNIFIPESYDKPVDEEEAFVNGIIVDYMVRSQG